MFEITHTHVLTNYSKLKLPRDYIERFLYDVRLEEYHKRSIFDRTMQILISEIPRKDLLKASQRPPNSTAKVVDEL